MQTLEYPSLKMNGVNYVLVPKIEFNKFKKLESKPRVKKEKFPKVYTETDEEGTWETIDFGSKGVNVNELINCLKK